MEKDLEKELEELLRKHKTDKCNCKCGIDIEPFIAEQNYTDNFWLFGLLSLLMLDMPKSEPKQPIINIYLGGDK